MAAPRNPSDYTYFDYLFKKLDQGMLTFITDGSSNIIASITSTAQTLFIVFLALYGWGLMRGVIQMPLMDFVHRVLRITFIFALALNVGLYSTWIVSFLWESPEALAKVITGATGQSKVEFLDQGASKVWDFGQMLIALGLETGWNEFPDFGLILMGYLVIIAGAITICYNVFLLVLAKTALAILLALGPIFILCLMFDSTKKFFEVWLGQCLNYVFLVVLAASVTKLLLTIFITYLGRYKGLGGTVPVDSIDAAAPLLFFSVISLLVLMQVSNIASALGGGIAMQTMGAGRWVYQNTIGRVQNGMNRMANERRQAKQQMKTDRQMHNQRFNDQKFRNRTGKNPTRYNKTVDAASRGYNSARAGASAAKNAAYAGYKRLRPNRVSKG